MWRYALILPVCALSMSVLGQAPDAPVVAIQPSALESSNAPASTPVGDLIKELSDADFAVRERATDALEAMGPSILDELRAAYHRSDSFEARSKLRDLAESIDLQQRLFGSVGFLGVQPARVVINSLPGHADAVVGMQLGLVVPGEAADRAGFEVGDIIVAVDGKPLPPGTDGERFASLLRDAGPGAVLRFTILRDRKIIERSTALGQRPLMYYMGTGDSWYYDRLSESMSAFRQWWFGQDEDAESKTGRRFPSTLRFPVDWDPAAESSDAPAGDTTTVPPPNADPSSLP